MEAGDSWTARLSTASRRYQSALQSRSDLHLGFEEINGEDDSRGEFPCPFCPEDFDIIGLCCHIDDEHPVEAKNGVCSICGMRVGMDMVGHITMQHGKFFKIYIQHRRRILKVGSHSTLSLLRKELREGNLQSLLGGSSFVIPCTSMEPDPLLSSFVHNTRVVDEPKNVQPHSSTTSCLVKKTSAEQMLESVPRSPLSDQEQEENAQRCEFVQELFLSTILGTTL